MKDDAELKKELEVLKTKLEEFEARESEQNAFIETLKDREDMFRQLIDQARHGMWIEDLIEPNILYVNEACARIFDVARERLAKDVASWRETIHPDDYERIIEKTQAALNDPDWEVTEDSYRVIRSTGEIAWIRDVTVPIRNHDGKVVRSAGIIEDYTDRKRAQDEIRIWALKIENLVEIARRMTSLTSWNTVFQLTLDAVDRLLGLKHSEIGLLSENSYASQLFSTDIKNRYKTYFEITPEESKGLHKERIVHVEALEGDNGDTVVHRLRMPVGARGLFQTISLEKSAFDAGSLRIIELLLRHTWEALKRIELQDTLRQQALHDPLTGVYNRYHLNQMLRKEKKRTERFKRCIAFLMIDIDRFKEINDHYGHLTGDRVLKAVADIIQGSLRESDIVVRFGGDEFLIILPETNGEVAIVQNRILERIQTDKHLETLLSFKLTVSIGQSHWEPGGSESVEDALVRADHRMYQDKSNPKKKK